MLQSFVDNEVTQPLYMDRGEICNAMISRQKQNFRFQIISPEQTDERKGGNMETKKLRARNC